MLNSLFMRFKYSKDGLGTNFLIMLQCLKEFGSIDQCFSNFNIYMDHWWNLLNANSDAVSQGWDLRFCISSKFLVNANTTAPFFPL